MGTTYSNCQVRTDSQEAVVAALTGLLKEPAYVSPAVNGWVGVYPEGGATNPDELAKQLSAELLCGVFSWDVYDSDVFNYSMYESGEARDEFNSDPGYFERHKADGDENEDKPIDPMKVQGSPEVLLPLCAPGTTLAAIQAVLHPRSASESAKRLIVFSPLSDDQYLFADFQASNLATLVGIDSSLALLSYRYIETGETREYETADFRLFKPSAAKPQARRSAKSKSSSAKAGTAPKQRDDFGMPTLVTAARLCRPDLVRDLLSSGYDVDLAVDTSSMRSQQKRNPAIADTLESFMRQRFGNIYESGMTALMAAAGAATDEATPQLETIQVLIEAGADVNAQSEAGRTALGEAIKNAQVVEILRVAGATE